MKRIILVTTIISSPSMTAVITGCEYSYNVIFDEKSLYSGKSNFDELCGLMTKNFKSD